MSLQQQPDEVLSVRPIKTRIFRENENLFDFIVSQIDPRYIHESMILAITSKIVSLAENQLLDKKSIDKHKLIDDEADHNLGEVGYGCFLTIKEGLFIPSAGIDESNSESDRYILYPKDPFASAQKICEQLKTHWGLQKLGVIITDSHTTPLRRGVTGISLSHWGFQGLKNMIGTPDLFGRELLMTTINLADGLATAATVVMGEANECRPLAIIQGAVVEFTSSTDPEELKMPLKEDLYYPFFKHLLK
jgi:F420-0:gamma-glutamyl ligase